MLPLTESVQPQQHTGLALQTEIKLPNNRHGKNVQTPSCVQMHTKLARKQNGTINKMCRGGYFVPIHCRILTHLKYTMGWRTRSMLSHSVIYDVTHLDCRNANYWIHVNFQVPIALTHSRCTRTQTRTHNNIISFQPLGAHFARRRKERKMKQCERANNIHNLFVYYIL